MDRAPRIDGAPPIGAALSFVGRMPAGTGSRGSSGGSPAEAAASARPALRRGSTMRPSSPASRSASSGNDTVRAFAIAAAAPRTARAPPATPSLAAPRAACSAQRSVATTSAAAATAQRSTAAPGTESAERATPASIAPAAPPAACPWIRTCARRSTSPMAQSEKVSHDPVRANESRGWPTSRAQAMASRKIASAYAPIPVDSSSAAARP